MNDRTTRIAIFGALEIAHGSAAPLRPPTQRVLALLGYLIVHHDVPQARDKLVDLLWPDLPPRQGRRMLSDTLWRARRLLTPPGQEDTPALLIAGDTVAFRPDPATWVDLIAFEQALPAPGDLASGTHDQIRTAVELYRGDFLEDCYDDWALYERERLREQYLSALQRLLAADQARQAYDLALQSALRLVQADPLREEAHRALMRLYHLLGRTDDALRAFAQCRTLLDSELGVEPEAETLSLYDELRALQQRRTNTTANARRMTTAPTVGIAIPNDLPFIGRQAVRAELMESIEQSLAGAGGMLLVAGAPGQGKSRLLHEVAAGATWRGAQVSWGRGREDAQALPLGALREALAAALTPLRARQVAEIVPPRTLSALLPLLPELTELLPGAPLLAPQPGEHQIVSMHAAIVAVLLALGQIAPQVLILEDLQWFDRATLEALEALLPALRARVLLVLSGRADELSTRPDVWEALLRLDRSGLLRRVDLPGLNEDECADLVRRALRMHHPAPRFSARLAAATGGNPFFMLETLRALCEQGTLHRDEQGIWHTPWDTTDSDYQELPLPAELRQAIDGRLRELPPHARATLAAAAVLGQNFSPDTLARMTTDDRRPTTDDRIAAVVSGQSSVVADQLLHGQFLVEERDGYRFGHNTLREVVYSELDEPTRQALHLRAAEVLEQEHYARVEALAQHLYLAGAWDKATPYLVQAGDHARAVCAYRAALRCYDQALAATEKLEARAIEAGESQDLTTRWTIYLKRGEICALLSDYIEAARAYRQALILAGKETSTSRLGARRSAQIQALNGLGFVYGLTNEYEHARAFSRRAIALAAESPRLQDRAAAFYQAGQTGYHMNNYEEALTYLQQALELYEAVDARDGQARCLERLAWIWRRQAGVTDQVIENLRRALAIYLELGDEYHEQHCRVSLANAYLLRGAFDEVLQSCDTMLPFFRASDARYSIAECQYLRGLALYAIGRLPEALAALDETVDVCQGLGITAAVQVNRLYRGQVLRALGRYDEGQADLEAAGLTDDRLVKPRALSALAELWLDRGDCAQAFEAITQALTLVQDVGSQPYLGVALRVLGQVRAADTAQRLAAPSRELPDTETCFTTSIELLQTAQYESDLAITYAAYGRYLAAQGRATEAHAALRQAQTRARRCGMAALLESLEGALQQAIPTPLAPEAGQVRVHLARQGTPRGRPLRPNEFVDVIWTIESDEYLAARVAGGKVAERHSRIRRLCAEALAQGAEPTVGDLADALGVNGRTIDRDIAALRAAGELVVTRGAGV